MIVDFSTGKLTGKSLHVRKQGSSEPVHAMLHHIQVELSNRMRRIDPPISVPNLNLSCSGKTKIKLFSLLEKTVHITWVGLWRGDTYMDEITERCLLIPNK